jgi:hypothetical protein
MIVEAVIPTPITTKIRRNAAAEFARLSAT